jgi:hypothetical protein
MNSHIVEIYFEKSSKNILPVEKKYHLCHAVAVDGNPKPKQMKQSRKLEGSFTNYMMGNNSTLPEVGKGGTLIMYSDRYPVEVLEVSEDKKKCVIRSMDHKAKPNAGGMGHQEWQITSNPDAPKETIVYRQGAWRKMFQLIEFDKTWYDSFSSSEERWNEIKRLEVFDDNNNMKLIEGVTIVKRNFYKINIFFGCAEYRYDWEF